MINISFNLSNPWSSRWQNLWNGTCNTPFKNKHVELEVIKDTSIISVAFHLSTQCSHGGLRAELGILGYSLNFNFHDNRHWNHGENRYFIYDAEGNET